MPSSFLIPVTSDTLIAGAHTNVLGAFSDAMNMTVLPNGTYVAVWDNHADTGTDEIWACVLDATGQPIGSPFEVSTLRTTPGGSELDQWDPTVTYLADGSFAVAWTTDEYNGGYNMGRNVMMRLFAADGTPLTDPYVAVYQMSDSGYVATSSTEQQPSLTTLADGSVVLTFYNDLDIGLRIYEPDGVTVRSTVEAINTLTDTYQGYAHVTALEGGGFVVTWEDSNGLDGSSSAIVVQQYNADGTIAAPQAVVNTATYAHQEEPVVAALAGGGYIIGWYDGYDETSGTFHGTLRGQIFAADGSRVGGELTLPDAFDRYYSNGFEIVGLPDGGFLVVFTTAVDWSGTSYDIHAQRFMADGTPLGEAFRVTESVAGGQSLPRVEIGPDGLVTVIWHDDGSGDTAAGVYSRTFSVTQLNGPASWGDDVIALDDTGRSLDLLGGNDVAFGGAGSDTLWGNYGHDTLYGGVGNDLLDGGYGNDLLEGEDGADTLLGGIGRDTLRGGDGNDSLSGQADDDLMSGGDGNDTLLAGAGNDTLSGGSGDDALSDWDGNDLMAGDAGNDTIWGGLGNDTLLGGADNDRLLGQDGNDQVWGGTGNDSLLGGAGDDALGGAAGNDRLYGEAGDDIVYGDTGNDTLNGGEGNDTLWAGADDDILYGISGSNILGGGAGNDMILGGSGDDIVYGDTGNDTLNGGEGNDTLWAGAGDDYVQGGDGNDVIYGTDGMDVLSGGWGNDTLDGGVDADNLAGDQGNDLLRGGDGSDRLMGGSGDDLLYGEAGNDTLYGETGNDTLNGGEGNDSLWAGADDDILYGVSGSNILGGGAGNDTIWGGSGDDIVYGDTGVDDINGGEGNDTLWAGAGDDYVQGGDGNDVIYGTDGMDVLSGGWGNDTLDGGVDADNLAGDQGNDLLRGGDGSDWLLGGSGTDTLTGGAGADFFVFQPDEDTAIITDLDIVGGDMIEMVSALWTDHGYGTLSAAEVIAQFASVTAWGSTVFTFDGGEVLVVQGVTDLSTLETALFVV